ncbi:hypothetical protein GCM10023185_05300 [Hymenobacter saemangeumensis]|uniref:Uncharacterized protein n=1 Tax=Hymenobacter saemangeumensis TaxID=1084522 RepID=A0ABP8I0M8_9BACT
MGKGKKKHSNKETVSGDLLDAAVLSVKKFRKVTREIGKLSTGQKLLGGAALVAAGLLYLVVQDVESEDKGPSGVSAATDRLPEAKAEATDEVKADEPTPAKQPDAPRKSRKSPKSSKSHSGSRKSTDSSGE